MELEDDGDLVRSVGFVALYAAYVEEQVDWTWESIIWAGKANRTAGWRPISQKIKLVQQHLSNEKLPDHQVELVRQLDRIANLIDHRNTIIHGRVYETVAGENVLKSGRPGHPDKPASSTENYDLANALFGCLPDLLMIRTLVSSLYNQ